MATNKETDKYQRLTQREHILRRPQMYCGNILNEKMTLYTANDSFTKIAKKTIDFNAGFIKLFDEILTNASDHCIRTGGKVKNIEIVVNVKDGSISIKNDGPGIPIEKKDGIWIPQMLFAELMTGENYNDDDQRFVGGMNGIGASLTNILSKKFVIECCDGKKLYTQDCLDNLVVINEPKIVKSTAKSYTMITYYPDLSFFNKSNISEDDIMFMRKRAMDIAMYCRCNVFFNTIKIPVNNLTDYARMHIDESAEIYTEKISETFEVLLTQSNTDNFEQCSIVNGISTYKGGTHVDYIMNQIVKRLIEDLTRGNKGIKVKPADIKSKFHLFLISKIANPTFDTQTKENLTIKIEDRVDLSDKLYKQLMKSEIIQSILEWVQMKEQLELSKMNKKSAGKTLRIEKLVDAHKAGTNEGYKCSIFLAEGDSPKTTIMAGLSEVGRDYYGVFPLKGKPLNVRDVKISRITENDEIQKILQIIGLVPGKKYTTVAELRYGKVIFATDADCDGYSIKGLLINFIHKFWPELLELGFCFEFITPIVVAKKGKEVKEYYDVIKYNNDKNNNLLSSYHCKYYKGLGTISAAEIKIMFKDLQKHLIKFEYIEDRDTDKIDMLFKKDRVADRKDWILNNENVEVRNKFGKSNELNEFFDTEFIQFSNADNIRSIPSLIDGFKPSQRKIMYCAFKKLGTTEKDETKVAQFGAYTAEQTHYAHGENNLYGTIVGMAQNFVGTNNVPLLWPSGQFGSRLNPDASASPRYIFTYLNTLTPLIFRKEDDRILNYLDEDGQSIEPEFYLPIIPTLLVNGSDGIGTGWSTNISKYNPLSLIKVIKKKIEKPNIKYNINPDFKGWTGELDWNDEKYCYVTKGVYARTKKGVLVTELPINVWTEKYVTFLDGLCDDKKIKNYIDNSTDNTIHIDVHLWDETKDVEIESLLKLTSNISLNNMHTFLDNKIVKWGSTEEMLDAWFDIRLKYYKTRKASWIEVLGQQYDKYYNILCFIQAVINGDIVVNNRKKDQLVKELADMEFVKIDDKFDYLLNIPVYHFTKEKFDEYKAMAKEMKSELALYRSMKPEDIWLKDLGELETALKKAGY